MSFGIEVEHVGPERQRIPAILVEVVKNIGTIKYSSCDSRVKVSLLELQLAPSANKNNETYSRISNISPQDHAEIWLDSKSNIAEQDVFLGLRGAWWPCRILTIQNDTANVEVISNSCIVSNFGSPYRLMCVNLEQLRYPWNGRSYHIPNIIGQSSVSGLSNIILFKDMIPESNLITPGILYRHSICIPAYLSQLVSSSNLHASLIKHCGASCLIQCESEAFLAEEFDKFITGDKKECNDLNEKDSSSLISESMFCDYSPPDTYVWPSFASLKESPVMNAPNLIGTMSSIGITDPVRILTDLPGVNGPLVLLHIWSASAEAISRATFLELGYVRLLIIRYHLLQSLHKNGKSDLELSVCESDETSSVSKMHCKPIKIPATTSLNETPILVNQMIVGYQCNFPIVTRLIGLAIGHRGSTIQEARDLPGVRTVELLDEGIVHVQAETIEACYAVRNLLDYTEAEIPVPPRLASRLIGSRGMNIRKLADLAGIRRAVLLDPMIVRKRNDTRRQAKLSDTSDEQAHDFTNFQNEFEVQPANEEGGLVSMANDDCPEISSPNPSYPVFYLLGTRAAVVKMRLLLEFQADNLNELDELKETRRNLFSQLHQSNRPGAIQTKPFSPRQKEENVGIFVHNLALPSNSCSTPFNTFSRRDLHSF